MKEGDTLDAAVLNLPLVLSGGGPTTTLADQTGRWVILYFYPKDNTPGCTTEGLEFNALLLEFERSNARVFGVSRDSIRSHDNFCQKYGFGFPLISDSDEALCRAFAVIQPKILYGKPVSGIERSTFLISPDHQLVQSWRKLKAAGHADIVLKALQDAQRRLVS